MEPIEVFWNRGDTFEDMRLKLLSLVGKEIAWQLKRPRYSNTAKLISVSDIKPDFVWAILADARVWAYEIVFTTPYILPNNEEGIITNTYKSVIPRRSKEYLKDLEKCQISIEFNHPIVNYSQFNNNKNGE